MGRLRENESPSIWYVLCKLGGFVFFHAIVYVYGRKIYQWLKGRKYGKISSKGKATSAFLGESLNSACEDHQGMNDSSEVSSSDEETKFIHEIDKFCNTGTKIQKSKKCIKYIKAIQRKAGKRLNFNKMTP